MKWITVSYLFLSVILAFILLYVMIANMVNYGFDSSSFYLDMFIKCIKFFLAYVILNIIYLFAIIFSTHKKKYC